MSETLPAVARDVTVKAPLERTFEAYTETMGRWWPPEYHIGGSDLADVVIEPRVGGRWYERGADGTECDWGRVLAWEPPGRLVLSWQITAEWRYDPDPAHGSEVEIRFTAVGPDSTHVELVHSRFERHAAGAPGVRAAMTEGLSYVLDRLRTFVESSPI
jgi:uncharacterized protein YndB with AHSA1/START domain